MPAHECGPIFASLGNQKISSESENHSQNGPKKIVAKFLVDIRDFISSLRKADRLTERGTASSGALFVEILKWDVGMVVAAFNASC